jgi:hypothetical protein
MFRDDETEQMDEEVRKALMTTRTRQLYERMVEAQASRTI